MVVRNWHEQEKQLTGEDRIKHFVISGLDDIQKTIQDSKDEELVDRFYIIERTDLAPAESIGVFAVSGRSTTWNLDMAYIFGATSNGRAGAGGLGRRCLAVIVQHLFDRGAERIFAQHLSCFGNRMCYSLGFEPEEPCEIVVGGVYANSRVRTLTHGNIGLVLERCRHWEDENHRINRWNVEESFENEVATI